MKMFNASYTKMGIVSKIWKQDGERNITIQNISEKENKNAKWNVSNTIFRVGEQGSIYGGGRTGADPLQKEK